MVLGSEYASRGSTARHGGGVCVVVGLGLGLGSGVGGRVRAACSVLSILAPHPPPPTCFVFQRSSFTSTPFVCVFVSLLVLVWLA